MAPRPTDAVSRSHWMPWWTTTPTGSSSTRRAGRRSGGDWRPGGSEVEAPTRPADLVGGFYELLADCGVKHGTSPTRHGGPLGALARCSTILADYESVRRRSRPDPTQPGQAIGGQDRGPGTAGGSPSTSKLGPRSLRGLRRRGRGGIGRRRPHHGPPGQGSRMAGRVRPLRVDQPLPIVQNRIPARLEGADPPLPSDPIRGNGQRRAAPVLCGEHPCAGLAFGLNP